MSACEYCGEYNCDGSCYYDDWNYDEYDDDYVSPWEEFLRLSQSFFAGEITEEQFIEEATYLHIDNFEIVNVIQEKRDKQLKTV